MNQLWQLALGVSRKRWHFKIHLPLRPREAVRLWQERIHEWEGGRKRQNKWCVKRSTYLVASLAVAAEKREVGTSGTVLWGVVVQTLGLYPWATHLVEREQYVSMKIQMQCFIDSCEEFLLLVLFLFRQDKLQGHTHNSTTDAGRLSPLIKSKSPKYNVETKADCCLLLAYFLHKHTPVKQSILNRPFSLTFLSNCQYFYFRENTLFSGYVIVC